MNISVFICDITFCYDSTIYIKFVSVKTQLQLCVYKSHVFRPKIVHSQVHNTYRGRPCSSVCVFLELGRNMSLFRHKVCCLNEVVLFLIQILYGYVLLTSKLIYNEY